MAEQVTIPAGVNPATASGGADTTTYGSPNRESRPNLPAVPAAVDQTPGFTQPPGTPAGVDAAQFAAFQEWQKAEAAKAAAAKAAPTPAQPTEAAPDLTVAAGEGIGADASVEALNAANDPFVNTAVDLLNATVPGLDLARALGNAIDRGDASLIDYAYLKEKGGDKADKVKSIIENIVKHVNTVTTGVVTSIYAQAGGQAQWASAAAAFSEHAPKYMKEGVAAALNSANPARIAEAAKAVVEFAKQSGAVVVKPTGFVDVNNGQGGALPVHLGLSKTQYQAERLKLNRFDRDYESKARELDARRAIGKRAGL